MKEYVSHACHSVGINLADHECLPDGDSMFQTAKILALIVGLTFALLLFVCMIPERQELHKQSTLNKQQVLSPLFVQIESPLLLPTATPTIGFSLIQSTTIPEVAPGYESALNLFPWKGIETQSQGHLIQVSNMPFGVNQVKWSPRFNQLWIDAVTAYDLAGNIFQSTGLLTGKYVNSWPNRNDSTHQCGSSLAWIDQGQSLLFLKGNSLWRREYDGNNQQEINLNEYTHHVLSVEALVDGSLATVLVEKESTASPQFDLLLLDSKTDEVLTLIENVGLGSLSWSANKDMFVYWGRTNRTDYSQFGAMRLSIYTISTGTLIQKDLATLVGADPCPQKPSWIENDTHLLLFVNSGKSPMITEREGNELTFQEYLLNVLRISVPRDSIPQLSDLCPKVIASPTGQYLLLSPDKFQISTIDLLNKTITNQIGGFLCKNGTNITWDAKRSQYLKWGADGLLVFVNPTQSVSKLIDTGGLFPAWSPSGRIVYWKKADNGYTIWMFDSPQGEPHQLTTYVWQVPTQGNFPFIFDMTPIWAPDGRSVAFVAAQNNKPEAYVIEDLSAESQTFWPDCKRTGLFYHCVDEQIGIEFDSPLRYGKLSSSLGDGMCGGFAYTYNYGFGGGLSWDYCQPMDGGQYNFRGFSAPQDKGVWTADHCSYFGSLASCEIMPNGVTFAVQIPSIDILCSGPAPGLVRSPQVIIAIDLPSDRIVQGYMFSFSFLSTKAEEHLFGPYIAFPPEISDCDSSELRQTYLTAAEQLQFQLKTNTTDEETSYKLEQIRHMAESIVIH